MNRSLGQHRVILEFGLAKRRRVTGDDNKLGLARSQRLERGFVAQRHFARLHDEREAGVD